MSNPNYMARITSSIVGIVILFCCAVITMCVMTLAGVSAPGWTVWFIGLPVVGGCFLGIFILFDRCKHWAIAIGKEIQSQFQQGPINPISIRAFGKFDGRLAKGSPITRYVTEEGVTYYVLMQKACLHRECGPAVEWPNGRKDYYLYGKLGRLDGPAIDGVEIPSWYWDGKEIGEHYTRDGRWEHSNDKLPAQLQEAIARQNISLYVRLGYVDPEIRKRYEHLEGLCEVGVL